MLFVDEFCGILVYIKFGADVTSQYDIVVFADMDVDMNDDEIKSLIKQLPKFNKSYV